MSVVFGVIWAVLSAHKIGNSGVTERSLKMLTRAARLTPAYAAEIIGLRDELAGIQTGVTEQPTEDDLPEGFVVDELPEGFSLDQPKVN
ncbi:hypothetical protein ACWPMX_03625 [Tsuneonella sp. HG094]